MTSFVALYESIQQDHRILYILTGFHAQNCPIEPKDNAGLIWKNISVNPNTKQWIWDYYYFDKNYRPKLISGRSIGKRVSIDDLQESDRAYVKHIIQENIWSKK